MKKKAIILTLNDYIIYQPSILNLYDFMQDRFDVTIVSFLPQHATKTKDETRNIIYLKTNFFLKQFFQKADFFLSHAFSFAGKFFPGKQYHYLYYNNYLPSILKSAIRKYKWEADVIIAADFPALHVAQQMYGSVHFISLEIENNTNPIHKKIDRSKVKSVFIQSKERYDYLFPGIELPVFYVQNAPVFDRERKFNYERKDFIWAGAMERRLAVMDCIRFFDTYPEYRLVLKGGGDKKSLRKINENYAHLLAADRVKIDRSYLPAASFLDFLAHFSIGICFYSWELINSNFNYATAPSGKLFMYLAAGVPVIACNIPGFKLVEEFGAGVLVDDFEPGTILKAVKIIEADYNRFCEGCRNAAAYFSFDERVEPYIDYLLKDNVK
jgi:glycosyltransferase involved in cell wall biosynthesis